MANSKIRKPMPGEVWKSKIDSGAESKVIVKTVGDIKIGKDGSYFLASSSFNLNERYNYVVYIDMEGVHHEWWLSSFMVSYEPASE